MHYDAAQVVRGNDTRILKIENSFISVGIPRFSPFFLEEMREDIVNVEELSGSDFVSGSRFTAHYSLHGK